MKNQKDHELYISMRVEGHSIEKSSSAVGISKRTGIKWDKEHSDIISGLQDEAIEELADRIRLSRKKRLARIGSFLDRIDEELDKRSLDNVTTGALVGMKLRAFEVVSDIMDAKKLEIGGSVNIRGAEKFRAIMMECAEMSPEDRQRKG